jgi:hypothetical protein
MRQTDGDPSIARRRLKIAAPSPVRPHSDDPTMAGRNFANMLAILDVLGGTWIVPDEQPASFGIRGYEPARGFVRQMLAPFADVMRRRATALEPSGPLAPANRGTSV